MRTFFSRRTQARQEQSRLYGAIVAAARQQVFYADWGVPDTVEGRFEMLALHTALVMRRLERVGEGGRLAARGVAEAFVADIDDNLREIGVSDLKVPAKVKRAAAALYDRHRDYGAALEAHDTLAVVDVLGAALGPAVEKAGGAVPDLNRFADYARRYAGALDRQSDADCLSGHLPSATVFAEE